MKNILIVLFSSLILSSCTYKYTPSSSAMINVTNYNIGDTSKLKTGESCYTAIMGFSAFDSSTSVIDAMKDGGISTIKMIDNKTVLAPFFYKKCTVVHGL